MIEHYAPGIIKIDGKEYREDVLVTGNGVNDWGRVEEHNLSPKDIEERVRDRPQVIIIGTGANGAMKVPEKTVKYVINKGIEFSADVTSKAVEKFNAFLKEGTKVVAGFHLTC